MRGGNFGNVKLPLERCSTKVLLLSGVKKLLLDRNIANFQNIVTVQAVR